MVGPLRPRFVFFGSSIVELSFGNEGWGATLAHHYARRADVFVRGYSGWNSRQALQVVDQIFPKDAPVHPALVLVYFGGNDSVMPDPNGQSAHVPLSEFVENMRKIALHLRSLPEKPRILFLTAPPVNEAQMLEVLGVEGRTNELVQKYAEACIELCREMGIDVIDLFTAIKQHDNWMTTCFTDGIHLSPVGSKIVAEEIMGFLKEVDWEPSLYWVHMEAEFL